MTNNQISAKQFIQQLRFEKYGIREDGTQDESRTLMAQDLKNAIEHLSKGLYGKDIHFILELIQNAEDNEYQEKQPDLEFLLLDDDPTNTEDSDGCLCLFNNEVGFTEQNIIGICGIGRSTKNKLQGYIGEKGIGFKSVFVVSAAPHIYSNRFQIKFLEDDPKLSLSYVVPYWLDSVPEIVRSRQANTSILLPLKKYKRREVEAELRKILPETILFLAKLQGLTIRFKKNGAEEGLELIRDQNLHPITRLLGDNDLYDYWLKTTTFEVPNDLEEEKRKEVLSREITIAFPLNGQQESGRIFAFLPTETVTGLPFLVNGDFILSSSRETIQTDRPWNQWLRDRITDVVIDGLLELLDSPEHRSMAYKFIPLAEKLGTGSV